MLNKVFVALATAATLYAASVMPAQAMGISSAARSIAGSMPVRTVAFSERANLSRNLFCLQYGNECRMTGRTTVAYTNKLRTTLASINRSVNKIMPALRAQREFLALSPLPGLADDYAMMKRSELIRAGIPAGSMRVANVTTQEGRRHSVLIVATTSGEFLLDHRRQTIMKRRDSGYSFASLDVTRFFE